MAASDTTHATHAVKQTRKITVIRKDNGLLNTAKLQSYLNSQKTFSKFAM